MSVKGKVKRLNKKIKMYELLRTFKREGIENFVKKKKKVC